MIWRDLRGQRTSDREDKHAMQGCLNQYHIRMWDDAEHGRLVGGHPAEQWVATPTHHERLTSEPGHKPDRDWDDVRVHHARAMPRHCSYKMWRYHPGADRTLQEFVNSGWVARLSMRKVSDGCNGA